MLPGTLMDQSNSVGKVNLQQLGVKSFYTKNLKLPKFPSILNVPRIRVSCFINLERIWQLLQKYDIKALHFLIDAIQSTLVLRTPRYYRLLLCDGQNWDAREKKFDST